MFFEATDPALAKTLTAAAEQMSEQLPIALKRSSQFGPDGKPFFVSPKLGVNMTAFNTMIESTVAEYSNFRYWTEALLAAELPDDYALALMKFRWVGGGARLRVLERDGFLKRRCSPLSR
jgi:hypothetical protein